MKNRIFLLLGMLLISFVGMAQTVSGKVTSTDDGTPIPGATVIVKGTTNGTNTDSDGKYSLEAGSTAILVFSFVGYASQEVEVGNRVILDVSLATDITSLQEIVVTALGIKKESKKVSYATSNVKVDELVQNRTINVMTSLEGKIAGLNIAPPAAGSGASTRIRLRGQTGFNGGVNSPLIVINGLPMDQGARSAEGGGTPTDTGDNMAQVNPDDVESMTVLKGSTAAALYGSRASNGAIIITTKSGSKNSKFSVDYTTNFAVDEARDYTNYQTVYGTGISGNRPATQADAVAYGNLSWGAMYDGAPTIQYDGQLRPYSADKNRMKEFYRNGTSFMNTIAISGGNAATSYRVSFSNLDAKGISPNNTYGKKIFNVGVNSKVTEKLTLQTNINFTHEETNNPPLVGTQGIGFSSFLNRTPLTLWNSTIKESVVNPDGSYMSTNPFDNLLTNPYFLIGRKFDLTKRDRVLGTVLLRYDFAKWLYVQGRVNGDVGYNTNEVNTPHGTGAPLRNTNNTGWRGTYDFNTSFNQQWNMDFLVGTSHKFGDFTLDGSVGGNTFIVNNRNTAQGVTDFVVRDLYSIGNGITKTQDARVTKSQVNSLYGFADFGYKNFLYLNVTDRQDWFSVTTPSSSVVANPINYKNYWSVGASFIFSEVISNKPSWLDYGKVRATYATAGSVNGVAPYSTTLTYAIDAQPFGTYPVATIASTGNPNPKIQPFGTSELEVGLDLRTLNNRLRFDIALYNKQTDQQLLNVPLSPASGYTSTNLNLAKLKNSGIEVLIEGSPIKRGNFSWNVSLNGAYNTSEVLALAPGQNRQIVVYFNGTGNEFLGNLTYDVGKQMNQLVSYTYLRDANGQVMLNSSGKLQQSKDMVNFGTANQNLTGGFINTFQYKKLSLLVHFDGKFGGKVFSSTALNGLRSGMSQASLVGREGVVFDGVLPDGSQNTKSVDPRIFYADYRNLQIADPFVFSSDFIKLRNITLTYDLSQFMNRNVKFVKGLTLSAYCRNVAVLLKHIPDVDPEAFASSSDSRLGYEQHTEPTTRTYGLNLIAKF